MRFIVLLLSVFFFFSACHYLCWLEGSHISIEGYLGEVYYEGLYWSFCPSLAVTCIISLSSCILNKKKNKSFQYLMAFLSSFLLGIAICIFLVKDDHSAKWVTEESITTSHFYKVGLFVFPDSAPATPADGLSEQKNTYAFEVVNLSRLYFWQACLDKYPPFLIGFTILPIILILASERKVFHFIQKSSL